MNESNFRKRGPRQLKRTSPHRSDFCFGRTLGEGSYAKYGCYIASIVKRYINSNSFTAFLNFLQLLRVVHCTSKHDNSQEFAIKIMAKDKIKNENKIKHVMLERQLLAELSSPYVIKLVLSFHDIDNLFICMEYVSGGDLRQFINSYCPQESSGERIQAKDSSWISITQFYIAELVEALEYVHSQGVIHRDIKPENVLITARGHIKLGDFGSALLVHGAHTSVTQKEVKQQERDNHNVEDGGHGESFGADVSPQHSFMGTSEYVSPEVLRDQEATRSSDYWALGCIVFKMHTSISPFMAGTEFLIFQKILAHADGIEPSPIKYPDSMTASSVDLVESLLRRPSLMRFGEDVKFGTEEEKISKLPIAANGSSVQPRLVGLLTTEAGPTVQCLDSGSSTMSSDGPSRSVMNSGLCTGYQDAENDTFDADRAMPTVHPLAEAEAIIVIEADAADSSVMIAPMSTCCSDNGVGHHVRDSRPPSAFFGDSLTPEADSRDLHRSLKDHAFFHGILWGELLEGRVPVPSWPAHESVSGSSLYGGDYTGFMFSNKYSPSSAPCGNSNAS